MPYEFLPEVAIADIAFRAWGKDLEEVFRSSADAVLNAMIDNLDSIEPKESRVIRLQNDALDMLLFDLLQEVIYYKDSEQLLLQFPQVEITEEEGSYRLFAEARGEKLDPERHQQRVDVKAVTLHQFQLTKTDEGWLAMVILDI